MFEQDKQNVVEFLDHLGDRIGIENSREGRDVVLVFTMSHLHSVLQAAEKIMKHLPEVIE